MQLSQASRCWSPGGWLTAPHSTGALSPGSGGPWETVGWTQEGARSPELSVPVLCLCRLLGQGPRLPLEAQDDPCGLPGRHNHCQTRRASRKPGHRDTEGGGPALHPPSMSVRPPPGAALRWREQMASCDAPGRSLVTVSHSNALPAASPGRQPRGSVGRPPGTDQASGVLGRAASGVPMLRLWRRRPEVL